MRYLYIIIPLLFTAGCSYKRFEPAKVEKKVLKSSEHYESLDDYTQNGLTFSELKIKEVPKKSLLDDGVEVKRINLDENENILGKFVKINKNLGAYGKEIYLIDENKTYTLPYAVYSATQNGSTLAVVFENGKYGLYDTANQKMSAVFDGDGVLSTRHLHASPVFYNDLVLFPLLSGNVAVVDTAEGKYLKTLNISQNQFNDNVIYLKIVNNHLFMATPSKLVLFNPKFLIDYEADIKHIIDYDGFIYIFTTDGNIIKLDENLKEIKKVKLPYASFFAPSVCKGNIWSVEREGYLLKISPDLNVTVYGGNRFDTLSDGELKMEGCKIYNNNKVFMIE